MLKEAISSVQAIPPQKIDRFGCPSSSLRKDQELFGNGVKFFRKSSDNPHLGQVMTDADDRGFLVGASLARGHKRRIFHAHHATNHEFHDNGIYIRNLSDDYRADLDGPFDFVLMEFSRALLIELREEHGVRSRNSLEPGAGVSDPILSGLLRVAQPALERSALASRLFLDQLGVTIGLHLIEHYAGGNDPLANLRGALSRTQLALATEMLSSDLSGNLPVAEVAVACGLSRGYFIRAFKETTGETPHRWVLLQRVARARELLLSSNYSLADVALMCGFADQSHFTRIFARQTGTPPGTWRRSARA